MPTRHLVVTGLLSLCVLTFGASNAAANFQLSVQNGALVGAGPYVDVGVALNAGNNIATVTFTSLVNGNIDFLMGAVHAVDLNVNGAYNAGSVTINGTQLPGFTAGTLSLDSSPNNVSAFGTFDLEVNDTAGFTNAYNSITVTFTKSSGTWSSVNNVLAPNADGHLAAAHVFECSTASSACSATQQNVNSGFVSDPATVPEPHTLFSLAIGAVAIIGFQTRRRRQQTASKEA